MIVTNPDLPLESELGFFVYVLRSLSTGRFYVGHTADIEDRLARHNGNRSKSTKDRGPWEVAYIEPFTMRAEACRREKEIKSWKSHRSIEELIQASGERPG